MTETASALQISNENNWCAWCKEHPELNLPLDQSVINNCTFILGSMKEGQSLLYMNGKDGLMHLHGVVVTTQEQLTIRAALKRRLGQWKYKLTGHRYVLPK